MTVPLQGIEASAQPTQPVHRTQGEPLLYTDVAGNTNASAMGGL